MQRQRVKKSGEVEKQMWVGGRSMDR
jgi:hypothetical protein